MATKTRAQESERDAIVEVLESELQAQLIEKPTDELWDIAKRMGVPFEQNGEPRRRSEIIAEIIVAEIETARRDMARQRAARRTERTHRAIPTDPDIGEGNTVALSVEEMALIFSTFLPSNAAIYPQINRAELFNRTAQRVSPDTCVFTRHDSQGNDRQYRVRLQTRWTVTIEGE